ncbi:MAG: hypothetical protein LIP08_07645 [Bacteroides sp.]|nr:hypothetical protein [Bacteroides sp.]
MGKQRVFFAFVCFLLAGCGVSADRAITEKGAGLLTFTGEVEIAGYTVTTELQTDAHESGDESDHYLHAVAEVRDEAGQLILRRNGDYLIEVFSSRYKTLEGVHVGMSLDKALKRLKIKEPEFYNPWPTREFIFEKELIGFSVRAEDLEGGEKTFEAYSRHPYPMDRDRFQRDARIAVIRIRRP